jgi:hypothetical protein
MPIIGDRHKIVIMIVFDLSIFDVSANAMLWGSRMRRPQQVARLLKNSQNLEPQAPAVPTSRLFGQ